MNNRTVLLDDIFGKVFRGHHYTDGQFSAEALREELLVPVLRNAIDHEFTITILSSGLVSASMSYLEELFGKLIAHGHFTKSELSKHLKIECKPTTVNRNFSVLLQKIFNKAETLSKTKYVSTMKDGISSGLYVPTQLNAYYDKYLSSIKTQEKIGRGSLPSILFHELDEVEFYNNQVNDEFREHLNQSFARATGTQNPISKSKNTIEQHYLGLSKFNKLYKVLGESSDGRTIINCLNNDFAIDMSELSDSVVRYILTVAKSFSINLQVKGNHLLIDNQSLNTLKSIEPKCVGFESDVNARPLRLETVYYLGSRYILVFRTKLNGVVAYSFDRTEFGHEDIELAMKYARHKHDTFKVRLGSKHHFIFDYILGYYFIDMNQLELYGCEEYHNPSELEAFLDKLPVIDDSSDKCELDTEIFTKVEAAHVNEGTIKARGMDFDVVIADDATFSRGLTSCFLPMDDSPYQTSPEKIGNGSMFGSHGGSEPQSCERDNSYSNDTSSSGSGGCD